MHTPAFTTAANRNSATAQNRIANDVSRRALKSCAYTRTLYSKICPSNASEHKPILTAANGSAFFRLASAMNGNTSESIPQVRLPTEHITEIEIVVDILSPPSFANSIPQYGWNGKNNAVQTINPHVNS